MTQVQTAWVQLLQLDVSPQTPVLCWICSWESWRSGADNTHSDLCHLIQGPEHPPKLGVHRGSWAQPLTDAEAQLKFWGKLCVGFRLQGSVRPARLPEMQVLTQADPQSVGRRYEQRERNKSVLKIPDL